MNSLLTRQLRSAGVRRNFHLLQRQPHPKPLLTPLSTLMFRRGVANTVSSKPASEDFGHAATNIKEELGNSATDLAKIIAAANPRGSDLPGEDAIGANFLGVTKDIAGQVPKPIMTFGLAGSIPYLGTAATSVWLANKANLAAAGLSSGIDPGVAITVLHQALEVQVTYGAVMLSFLGALHWGMEFAGYGGHKGTARLALGAAPVLYAWPTLMLDPVNALIAQWAGFTALWYADSKVSGAGWTPKWYSQYRFYLSILVGTCIIGTLAGTSYFGPVAGHNLVTHDLELIREEREKYKAPQKTGIIESSEFDAVPAPQNADHYTILRKHQEQENKGKN